MSGDRTFGDTVLPHEFDQRVRKALATNERLLWVGQPWPRLMLLRSLPTVWLAIPWTALAVFIVSSASEMAWFNGNPRPRGDGFTYDFWFGFGVLMVLHGMRMLSSPYWSYRQALNTCYALTDRRAVTFGSWLGFAVVRSYGPKQLAQMECHERSDGSGDLVFEHMRVSRRHSQWRARGFLAIKRVKDVEELMRQGLLARSARAEPAEQ